MNTYLPHECVVKECRLIGRDSVLLRLKFKDKETAKEFDFIPGQFIQLSMLGYGEIPVGIASSPKNKKYVEVSVRRVGNVSQAAHRLEVGDVVGLRGPFGNGFKQEWFEGKDLLLISGGCGIPPIRSFLLHAIENRKKYSSVSMLYGSKTQKDLLFSSEYEKWAKKANLLLTVDEREGKVDELGVDCGVGVVTTLLDNVDVTENTVAAMCGPSIMYRFVIKKLLELNMNPKQIYVSLERRMKCGIGKCQHCTCGSSYVCLDGPVFSYHQIMKDYGGF